MEKVNEKNKQSDFRYLPCQACLEYPNRQA